MSAAIRRYFHTWWLPPTVTFVLLALLFVSEELLWTFWLSNVLFYLMAATLLATAAGVVVQLVRKKWKRTLGSLALTIAAGAVAALFLIAAAFSRASKTMPRPVDRPRHSPHERAR